jgi:hypothetical protein
MYRLTLAQQKPKKKKKKKQSTGSHDAIYGGEPPDLTHRWQQLTTRSVMHFGYDFQYGQVRFLFDSFGFLCHFVSFCVK